MYSECAVSDLNQTIRQSAVQSLYSVWSESNGSRQFRVSMVPGRNQNQQFRDYTLDRTDRQIVSRVLTLSELSDVQSDSRQAGVYIVSDLNQTVRQSTVQSLSEQSDI